MNFNTNNSIGSLDSKGTRSKVASPSGEKANSQASAPEVNPPANKAGDQVVLSQEAQNAGRLQAKINSLPDVNMERVAELRRAIAEGKFEINAERIAENMLNQEQLLG